MSYKISEYSVNALLRISDVSIQTGISVLTLRNWEKRYQVPSPTRTQGGQRLYSVEQVEILKKIKSRIDAGERAGKVLRGFSKQDQNSQYLQNGTTEPLVQLIYASAPNTQFTQAELNTLIKNAAVKNQQNSITGLLLQTSEYFLQVIEGPRSAINELYLKIVTDSRHKKVTLIKYQTITSRSFSKWGMSLLTRKDLSQRLLSRLDLTSDFDAFALDESNAYSLLTLASLET